MIAVACGKSWFDDVGTPPSASSAVSAKGCMPPSGAKDAGRVVTERSDAADVARLPRDADGNATTASSNDAAPDGARDSLDAVAPEAGAGPRILTALTASLAAKAPGCLACAEAACPNALRGCADLQGRAAVGPAKGEDLSELCLESTTCILQSACAASDLLDCYCGTAYSLFCASSDTGNGACKTALQRSLETTDEATIQLRFGDYAFAGGWATSIAQCLSDNGCGSCFQGPATDR